MATQAEYQQMLVDAIKSGDKRFAHLAQYGLDAPFYGGSIGDGSFQFRYRGTSTPYDLGGANGLSARSGAEILARYRKWADEQGGDAVKRDTYEASPEELALIDKGRENGVYQFGEPILRGPHSGRSAADFADEYYAKLLGELPGQIDPAKQYLTRNIDLTSMGSGTGSYSVVTSGGSLHEVGGGYNPQALQGKEQIRSGELDNAVNNITEQLNEQFDRQWGEKIEPALRQRGMTGDLGATRDKERQQYLDSTDWSKLIQYDPNVGMYTDMGAIKHVNDKGVDWFTDRVAPIMPAVAAAIITGNVAAPVSAAAGAAASTAATTATGTAVAGTIAGGAAQGLAGAAIGSAITGTKPTGKTLATSMLMGGITPYANANLAQYLSKPGVAALLETIRQAATNKGRVDPRLVAANTAGNVAAGWVGDQIGGSGIVGKFLGGTTGSLLNQSIRGDAVNGGNALYAGMGNTGTVGSMMAKAAGAYQRQMALRQQMAQRGGR